jgi:YD repeat-containing protein
MNCPTCGALVRAGRNACVRCGSLLQPPNESASKKEASYLRTVLVLIGTLAWSWFFRYALWNAFWVLSQHWVVVQSPAYLKGLQTAEGSPEIQRLVGGPVKPGGFTIGEVRRGYGTEFTEWSAWLKGPHGGGHLYAVANRVGDSWDYSRLTFVSSDGGTVDLTPPPHRDSLKLADEVSRVYLVALDPAAARMIDWAPRYYELKLGLEVTVLPQISLDSSVTDPKRKQVVAEMAVTTMRNALPDLADDPSAVLIGVTSRDMYIRAYDWAYATNWRERRFAVISTARLQPFADLGRWNRQLLSYLLLANWNVELVRSRLQKLLTKNLYVLAFNLPLSNDWTSLVGAGVRTGAQVDWMGSEIIGSEKRWDAFVESGDPDVSLVTEKRKPPVWRFDYVGDPRDTSSESFVADLRIGLFIQRKTDFIFKDAFPLYFSRAYRNQDQQSRAFGIGTNDTLDMFLVGKMGSYIELVLDDGGVIHFDRDTSSGNGELYRPNDDAGEWYSSTLVFDGNTWRLTREDGWVYLFPYRPNASPGHVTVLTGFQDPQGHRFEMQRNEAGDLLSLQTPSGKWLKFLSDPQHRINRVTDSEGHTLLYEYDAGGRLARVSDPQGPSESYRYDKQNELTAVLDSNEQPLITNVYSPDGFITEQILGDGRRFLYSYQRNARALVQSVVTDPQGYVTQFDFTSDGYGYQRSLPQRPAVALKQ